MQNLRLYPAKKVAAVLSPPLLQRLVSKFVSSNAALSKDFGEVIAQVAFAPHPEYRLANLKLNDNDIELVA